MTALAGCQREPVESTNDPDKKTVNAKFVLNINPQSGSGSATKMTAANVQAGDNPAFLGMQEVHILTYDLDESNRPTFVGAPATTGDNPVVGRFFFNPFRAGRATEDFNFGHLLNAGTVTSTSQSRVIELALPLATNAVVLYGKALNSKGPEHQGSITAYGDPANLASLKFSLTPRVDKTKDSEYKAYTAGAFAFQSLLSSLTISGLVDEQHYWTTDGLVKSEANSYLPTGTENKQFKIWYPYKPNDPLYQTIKNRFTKSNAQAYANGEEYVPIEGDPVSTQKYTLKVGNCSWKMLGDMYAAKHDGDDTTDPAAICLDCGGNGLELDALCENLGMAFYRLMTISTITETIPDPTQEDPQNTKQVTYHEIRAGSAAGILRTLRDLDFIIQKTIHATPTTWSELVAQKLASEIHDRMELYFTGEKDGLLFKDANTIRTKLAGFVDTSEDSDYEKSGIKTYFTDRFVQGTGTANDGTDGFPMNIGFPMGAAYIESENGGIKDPKEYWKAPRFMYKEDIPAYAFGTPDKKFNIFDYCYPAELMYYGNSPLRVSSVELSESAFPATVGDWETEALWANPADGWSKFSKVNSETRSVAMVDHINYGSALLKSIVVYDGVSSYLEDNNALIHTGESANRIPIDATHGLTVTGIVIGGQPEAVTWDFTRMPDTITNDQGTPDDTSDDTIDPPSYENVTFDGSKFVGLSFTQDQFGKMIYDKIAEADRFMIGDTDNNTVYTLCWDNYDATVDKNGQADAYIALELRNDTNEDFWGETNLVRKGAIFYLVGKLDLQALISSQSGNYGELDGHLGDRSKGYYYYPPFNPQTGATIEVPRVFMQDYVTTATLKLTQNALKHAYTTVPDLRSEQVSLGLSVDTKWEAGLSFSVEMGKLN